MEKMGTGAKREGLQKGQLRGRECHVKAPLHSSKTDVRRWVSGSGVVSGAHSLQAASLGSAGLPGETPKLEMVVLEHSGLDPPLVLTGSPGLKNSSLD